MAAPLGLSPKAQEHWEPILLSLSPAKAQPPHQRGGGGANLNLSDLYQTELGGQTVVWWNSVGAATSLDASAHPYL